MSDLKINANLPEILQPLFEPCRYKVLYGGRGGAKSWGIAIALLILGTHKTLRILCARELQKSIKDSVHRLLKDQIQALGLEDFYEIQQTTIKGKNGTEFFFEGLRHNAAQIKSYEGADIVWVEEAALVSKTSWDFLIPTIRKPGSEIWVSFNPELEEDETYQRFVLNPPNGALVIKVNWHDNPWFPEVLKTEMEDLNRRDPAAYLNVWEGQCKSTVEGAIYADEMRIALEGGRITNVPYDASQPVHTAWDLGRSDNTSIWFFQKIGFEYRLIDFYQNSGKFVQHYIDILNQRGYMYGIDYLPHDATSEQISAEKTVERIFKDAGRKTKIVPRVDSLYNAINQTRTIFSSCYFDAKKCADGLQSLRRYRYETNPETNRVSKNPLHDIYSHAADSFRTFAMGFREQPKPAQINRPAYVSGGWMGA